MGEPFSSSYYFAFKNFISVIFFLKSTMKFKLTFPSQVCKGVSEARQYCVHGGLQQIKGSLARKCVSYIKACLDCCEYLSGTIFCRFLQQTGSSSMSLKTNGWENSNFRNFLPDLHNNPSTFVKSLECLLSKLSPLK
jgi:hypothetical protein